MYDQQNAQSVFVSFHADLTIDHQYTVKTWDQRWQILVGAFHDVAQCSSASASTDCAKNDDILVLNRQNGQIEQYVFSFGRQYQLYDNRAQAFLRQGYHAGYFTHQYVDFIDATTFSMVSTQSTSIRNEELY